MDDGVATGTWPRVRLPGLISGLGAGLVLAVALVLPAVAHNDPIRAGADENRGSAAPAADHASTASPTSPQEAIRLLERCGEGSDAGRVAAALDVLRAAGPGDGPGDGSTAEVVSALLPYHSSLYRNRDKLGVVRLRAYLLATLADLEVPSPAPAPLIDALVDTLVHADDGTPSLELAAAARAAGSLGQEGRFFLPHLLYTVFLDSADEPLSLERYSPDFPAGEATTAQLEAVRALGRLAGPADAEVVDALARLAAYPGDQRRRRLVTEAATALAAIRARPTEPTPIGAPR